MKYLFFVLFFFSLQSSFGQKVSGTITDQESGEALIGASVYLKSNLSIGTTSDLDGFFSLDSEEAEGVLTVSYIGYESQEVVFSKAEPLVIQLVPAAAQMEEVVIKAKKIIAQEFSVEKISKLGIYLNPSAKGDPLLAVQSLPAASSVDETANISLRGSPPSETGIFLNNVPIRDAVSLDQSNGVGQFSIFNTSMIQSVNVFPSNPPIEFGGASSGAVALYTDDKLTRKSTSVNISLVGGGLYISRPITKKTAVVAYANLSTHQGLTGLNPKAFERLHSFKSNTAGLYGIHKFSDRSILKIFNFTILEGYEFLSQEPSFDALFTQKKDRNMTVANYSYQWNNARFEWNQGWNISKANYSIGNIAHEVKNMDYFLSLGYHYFKNKWSIKTGTALTYYQNESAGQFPIFAHAYESQHPSLTYAQSNKIAVPEVYLYGKYKFSKKLVLGMGSRYSPARKGQESYLSNQVNIAFKPQKEHSLTASIGNYNKFQFPGVAVPELTLSKSQQYALDYRYEKEKWTLSAAIYQKKIDNSFTKNPIEGAEIFAARRGRRLGISLSVAHINSTIETEENSYPSRFDLDYFVKAIVKYTIPTILEINAVFQQRQGVYFLPVIASEFDSVTDTYIPTYAPQEGGERLPTYRILDLSFSKILAVRNGNLILYANAGNLLNFRNIRAQSYNRDYSQRIDQLYNQRSIFVGGVYQW